MPKKATANVEKHSMSFKKAASAWDDETAITRENAPFVERRLLLTTRLRVSGEPTACDALLSRCPWNLQNGSVARKATKEEEILHAELRRLA